MIQKVTQAIVGPSAPRSSVRVVIREVPKTNWGIGGCRRRTSGAETRVAANEIHRARPAEGRSRTTLVARPIRRN